jgi:glycosyltransferase involved in cell wall biosynthesis
MVGPRPPPPGGVAAVVETIVGSALAERFDFARLVPADHSWQPRHARDRFVNRALCRGFGLDGFVSLESGPLRRAFHAAFASPPALLHVQAACGYDCWQAFWMAREARRRGVPSLVHLHGVFDVRVPTWSRAKQALFRRGLAIPDRVVVLSEQWRRWFSDWVDESRLVVVRNAVDVTRFRPRDAAPGSPIRALFVGAYDPKQKGAYDILAAAPALVREIPSLRFVFVGRDADDLEARFVRGTPLAPHFEFTGSLQADAMPALYESSDLLLLPSYGEGLPIALLEAMASGLPVVTCPVNAIPEVMRDPENGRFVPPGDPGALAAAIRELALDPALRRRIGAANRRVAEEQLDVAHHVRALDALYTELLARRTRA